MTSQDPASPFLIQVPAIIAPLVPQYMKNREEEAIKLQQAIADKDLALLRRIGHNLRGSAGAYGLPPLSVIGGRIEDAALASDLAAVGIALEDLRAFLRNVKLA